MLFVEFCFGAGAVASEVSDGIASVASFEESLKEVIIVNISYLNNILILGKNADQVKASATNYVDNAAGAIFNSEGLKDELVTCQLSVAPHLDTRCVGSRIPMFTRPLNAISTPSFASLETDAGTHP
jgi:hypothetical protein